MFYDGNVSAERKEEKKQSKYAIDVENLRVRYETSSEVVMAVNGIDLQLKRGVTLGIVGETGAGKTTSMLSLMNLIETPPGVVEADHIYVNGTDVQRLSAAELCKIRGNEIAMIFQDPMTSLNPVMKVGEQISESIMLHGRVSKKEAMERAARMLEIVGISPSRASEYPHQFSGGMRQRVGIAIALACKPEILIADEPTTALDVTIQAQVLKLMKQLKTEYGTSMILITHDLGVVARMCDEVAVMYAGRIVEQGTLKQIFNETLHPYTEGLFNSLPNIHNRVASLKPIPGLMPDPANLPQGCAFAKRCPYAAQACYAEQPARKTYEDGHSVWCTAYRDAEFHIKRKG
ncbi:MAG: ABC transporter ATP-binding protein [Lachnospiraceae bacterium]|jgi:peptide/nickel transport system ATP-binding protein|nr:ABC transporter ATP-binding protein [Lachnospiraceae bacterium]